MHGAVGGECVRGLKDLVYRVKWHRNPIDGACELSKGPTLRI